MRTKRSCDPAGKKFARNTRWIGGRKKKLKGNERVVGQETNDDVEGGGKSRNMHNTYRETKRKLKAWLNFYSQEDGVEVGREDRSNLNELRFRGN